jgi:hypothetical protein
MTFSSDPSLNTNQLPISLDVDPDSDEFESILLLYLRRIANAVNTKENGLFLLQETASFEQWFGATPQQNRNGYRTTFDLVALNGGAPIGPTFSFVLTKTSQPPIPVGYKYPVQGFGGALDSAGTSYFLNDPDVYVRFVASTNTISITNTTGNTLTWAVFVMEYLKN